MELVLHRLTLPPYSFFGAFIDFFKNDKGQVIKDFLADSANNWFILEEQIPDSSTSKLTSLSEDEVKSALKYRDTVTRINKKAFSVKLQYENLTLCDGNTLTLNVSILVKITDPKRFYRRYLAQFNNILSLEGDSLHKLWEAPFRNVLQVEAHKYNLKNWKAGLTETTIKTALERYYFAPMAVDYIDGTELELVKSVEGFSPSEEKRLEQELAKQRAVLKQKQDELAFAQNQKKHEAELALIKEQTRLKELEIKAKQEERIAQEKAFIQRKEQEELEAKKRREQWEHDHYLALVHSKIWPTLSKMEKNIAINFSIMMKSQMEVNCVDMVNSAIETSRISYRGIEGDSYSLRAKESLAFSFTPSKSGFITILNLGTSGKMTVLVPNSLTGSDTMAVRVNQGVTYSFPKSIMPILDEDAFMEQENAVSGFEGIYVLVTEQPLLFYDKTETDDLTELSMLSYDNVQTIMDKLKGFNPNSWSAGCLEFQVLPKKG